MQHPDTVRQLLPELHIAAEAHRFMQEHIDASTVNEGSREAKTTIYLNKIEAVRKALSELNTAQEGIMADAFYATERSRDEAIQELITNPQPVR